MWKSDTVKTVNKELTAANNENVMVDCIIKCTVIDIEKVITDPCKIKSSKTHYKEAAMTLSHCLHIY
jgi:hypothetical protein